MATAFSDGADFWNKRFDTPDYIFGRAPNEYLQTQTKRHLKKGDTVLCVADGEVVVGVLAGAFGVGGFEAG